MRVIAGIYKKRPLYAPPGTHLTRPTADRVKESLFNILMHQVQGTQVLDLFSGSGALGIEALSRGAKHVVFVEQSKEALTYLQKNLQNLKIPPECYTIVCAACETFLASPFRFLNAEKYAASRNLIFADPPYASPWYAECIRNIENSGLCAPQTNLVLEMSSRTPASILPHPAWTLVDTRTYGAARLEFWIRKQEEH